MKNIMKNTCFLLLMSSLINVTISPAFAAEKKILYWAAPMNPKYHSAEPGKSPMGMDLVPVYADEDQNDIQGNDGGRATIRISPETIQNIGVRTKKAIITNFGSEIKSYGIVTENIRMQQDISSRVDGWIELLKITAIGDVVKKGDLLFTMYSPELVSAQQDYIVALTTRSKGRINSAAKRLKSLGVQKRVFNDLKKNHKKIQNMPFYAQTDGVISKLNIKKGTFVKSGMQIAEIQDYSSVWINVSVAEKDLQFITQNSKAIVTFPNLGNFKYTAIVDYIYPTIDVTSRTGQIRLILNNIDGKLKPGAYVDVKFESNIKKRLSVQSEAVLKRSDGDFVVIAKGRGRFQPRKIQTGIITEGRTEIISGVKNGDEIVVSSQFLIDSESSLRDVFTKMEPPKELSKSVDNTEIKGNNDAGK